MLLTSLASALPPVPLKAQYLGFINTFGIIVAIGVLVGSDLLRKYARWHNISEEHIGRLTFWLIAFGFVGAHLFDVLAYQWDALQNDPLLLVKFWSGISSYGGFIGGAFGFVVYVWWKRLPWGLMADIAMVGLLTAFSIGRVACTVVNDHVGRVTTFWGGMDYPAGWLGAKTPAARMHNLGLYELVYLIPVCAIVLGLAFRKSKRLPAGFLAALAAVLYAPVRFFLDYLRPENSDPRHLGLTFAQWGSIAAFAVALILAVKILSTGKAAPTTDGGAATPQT